MSMPTMGYFRTMSAITMGNLSKTRILMIKVKHTCLSSPLYSVTPLSKAPIMGDVMVKFSFNSRYDYNFSSSIGQSHKACQLVNFSKY